MKSPFSIVMMKEIIENLRDRRTITSSIVMGSLLGPILFVMMINFSVKMRQDKAEAALEVPVINMAGAESLTAFLKRQGVKILSANKAPEQIIRDKDHDAVLEIDAGYSEDFAAGRPAKVKLYYDDSAKGAAGVTVTRIKQMIAAYSGTIGASRLQLRGVSPSLMQAVYIEDRDTSTAESRGAMVMSFLPYFLIMGLFMGSMYLAIDTTAGEKERKSMEPLFINPVSRTQILSGKLAATFIFGLATLVFTLAAFRLSIPFLPLQELGMTVSLGLEKMAVLLVILVPVALMAASLQTIIAAFSKNFREAQTYVSLIMFVPMIPSMLLMFMPVKEKLWMMFIPILGQNLIINQMMRGDAVGMISILAVFSGTLVLAIILAWMAVRLYNKESMLFAD